MPPDGLTTRRAANQSRPIRIAGKVRRPNLCPLHRRLLVKEAPVAAKGRNVRLFGLGRPNEPVRSQAVSDRDCGDVLASGEVFKSRVCISIIEPAAMNVEHYWRQVATVQIALVKIDVDKETVFRKGQIDPVPIVARTPL